MKKTYEPPAQAAAGQIFDSVFLLIYVVLLTPILLGLTAGNTVSHMPEVVNWETLDQNPTMVAQWEKLGFTAEEAAPMITERFDYTVKPVPLIITAIVVIGYFVMLLVMSDKEYREVIAEKFD